jgi:hypothetical protein
MQTNAHHFFIQQQANAFNSKFEMALRSVGTSRSIIELVRACNSKPIAAPHVRWMDEVKRSTHKFNTAVEAKAQTLIQSELQNLESMLESGDVSSFTAERGRFCRDLRYLGGHAPRALQKALVDVARIRVDANESAESHEIERDR